MRWGVMRWIVRLGMLLLVMVVVFVGAVLMLPQDRIARIAAKQISALTGREVTMRGQTRLSVYPVLGVSTGEVVIANAEWSDGPPMFRAERLKIGVEPQVLWGGDIRITGLEAIRPEINLERAADGRVNWELGIENIAPSGLPPEGEPGAALPRSEWLALTLDRALIRDATFRYTDHGTGRRIEMKGMDFDLRWPERQGPASFDVTLRPVGAPVRITGRLDRLAEFIDGAITDLAADLEAPGGRIAYAGRAGVSGQLQGRLTLTIEDSARFLAALGASGVEIPAGLGRSARGEALVSFAQKRLTLRKAALQLDGNRLQGEADIALGGARPAAARAPVQAGTGARGALRPAGPPSPSTPRRWGSWMPRWHWPPTVLIWAGHGLAGCAPC